MKKSLSAIVLTLTGLLGLGISARAQDVGKVVVNVPFEFVAGDQTLPAGTYSISRVSDQAYEGLLMRSYDNRAFLLPLFFDAVSADHAGLRFDRVDNKYFLSKVETPAGVYAIKTQRAMTQVAQMKDHGIGSPSGTN